MAVPTIRISDHETPEIQTSHRRHEFCSIGVTMKIPTSLLGLLFVTAPLVACAGEIEEPTSQKPEETQSPLTQTANPPPQRSTPPPPHATTPADSIAAPIAEDGGSPTPSPREDPCPPCGMG